MTAPEQQARRWTYGLRAWGFKFRILLDRNCRIYIRNPGNVLARFLLYVSVAIAAGIFLFGVGKEDGPRAATDMMGTLIIPASPRSLIFESLLSIGLTSPVDPHT